MIGVCIGQKVHVCMFLLLGQGDSKALICILRCMVIRAYPRRQETRYDGVLRWFYESSSYEVRGYVDGHYA